MSTPTQTPFGLIRLDQLSYFETISAPRRLPLSLWMCLSVIAVTVLSIISVRLRDSRILGGFGLYGVLVGLVPLNTKITILLSWAQFVPQFVLLHGMSQSEVEVWLRQEFKSLGDSLRPCYFGIFFALFFVTIYATSGAFGNLNTFVALSCGAITMLAAFVCGTGLGALYGLNRSIWRLGRNFAVRMSEHSYGILSVGKALMKCYGIVALVCLLATGSAVWTVHDRWIVLLVIDIPALCFVVGSFIVCQYPLHIRMVECKRNGLFELDNLLERLVPQHGDEISEDRKHQVEFCLAEMKRLEKWPEWPFSRANLSGVVGAWVVTLAPHFVKMALEYAKLSPAPHP